MRHLTSSFKKKRLVQSEKQSHLWGDGFKYADFEYTISLVLNKSGSSAAKEFFVYGPVKLKTCRYIRVFGGAEFEFDIYWQRPGVTDILSIKVQLNFGIFRVQE